MDQTPTNGRRILIVNSDLEYARVLGDNLKNNGGFDVVAMSDVETALKLVKTQPFQVVLSDLDLSGSSGLDFAHEIRKEQIFAPEIIILSNDPKVSLFDIHQVGACHVVRKPINMEELFAVIDRVGSHKRRYERIAINPTTLGQLFGNVSMVGKNQNFKVEVSNLGRGGFFYHVEDSSQLPEVGQVVEFDLKLAMVPNYQFAGRGIVRWIRHTPADAMGAGVEFLTIPEDSERLVIAFVDLFKVRSFVPDHS